MPDTESETARGTRLLIDSAKATTTDLYTLLGVPSPFTTSTTSSTTTGPPPTSTTTTDPTPAPTATTLKRAWRAAALKHHPDKNPGCEKESADKLDEIRKAYEILSHEEARRAYDEVLRGKVEKRRREEAFEGKRRRMKEELEMREGARRGGVRDVWVTGDGDGGGRGAGGGSRPGTPGGAGAGARFGATGGGSPQAGQKRKFAAGTAFGGSPGGKGGSWMHGSVNGEEDAELRRLAAEGARRRQEREEKMRRERERASRGGEQGGDAEGDAGVDGDGDASLMGQRTNGQSTPAKKFTFSTPGSSAQKTGVGTGSATPSSASNKSMFQNTMQRLREAEQRRKSGLQQVAPQNEDESTAVG